jgi:hypothetical protein
MEENLRVGELCFALIEIKGKGMKKTNESPQKTRFGSSKD